MIAHFMVIRCALLANPPFHGPIAYNGPMEDTKEPAPEAIEGTEAVTDQPVEQAAEESANDAQGPSTEPSPAKPSDDAAEDSRPTVLVVHASVGSGHRSAAYAIGEALELLADQGQAPEGLRVEVLDILDFGRIVFDGDKTASMFTGATRPLYDLTWRYTLTGRLLWAGGTIWARIMYPKFVEYVSQVKPIAIVCTHITAANVAVSARMLTRERFPIVCVPTDYEVEGLWPHLYTDLFCVANEHMAETLRPRRVPEERIQITGIPTRPTFRDDVDGAEVRERFGLPTDKQVVLALAGATLPRPYVHFRQSIDEMLPYMPTLPGIHLVIVAGNDQEYARHVRARCAELELDNVTVLGYVDHMADLMAASDTVICKSGGLVVTECLCARTPMVLLGRAYGQEKANVLMLTAAGAALHVTTARELVHTLRHISNRPESTRAMLLNASFLRKPEAALDIARATLELASPDAVPNPRASKRHFMHFYFGGKPAHTR